MLRRCVDISRFVTCWRDDFDLELLLVQGLAPLLHIHSSVDLKLLQTITWTTQTGFAALAISGDGKWLAAVEQEQQCKLAVWNWQEVRPSALDY